MNQLKFYFLAFYLCLFFIMQSHSQVPDDPMDLLPYLKQFRENRTVPSDPKLRIELISRMRTLSEDQIRTTYQFNPALMRQLLIALGDKDSIDQAINDLSSDRRFPSQNAINDLSSTPTPQVFAALGPVLFREEGTKGIQLYTGDFVERVVSPPSTRATWIIRNIISDSKDVPQVTKDWFDKAAYAGGDENYRKLIREWWKINEEALTAGNWKEVKPGPPLPPRKVPGG
jgi:hypothetical protein